MTRIAALTLLAAATCTACTFARTSDAGVTVISGPVTYTYYDADDTQRIADDARTNDLWDPSLDSATEDLDTGECLSVTWTDATARWTTWTTAELPDGSTLTCQ